MVVVEDPRASEEVAFEGDGEGVEGGLPAVTPACNRYCHSTAAELSDSSEM